MLVHLYGAIRSGRSGPENPRISRTQHSAQRTQLSKFKRSVNINFNFYVDNFRKKNVTLFIIVSISYGLDAAYSLSSKLRKAGDIFSQL
jgi:hypothetical protein